MKINRIAAVFSFLAVFLTLSPEGRAEGENVFKTSYTDIYYSDEKTLSDFLWRISGKRFETSDEISLMRSKVDRLIDRVEAVLDMFPGAFHVKIKLYSEYKEGLIASYNRKSDTIMVYADKITDGIFAHEAAHAIICDYFDSPPPAKMQEILTQYVDKHLWDDY